MTRVPLLCMIMFLMGCSVHGYRIIPVNVVNAETGQSIPGAKVSIRYAVQAINAPSLTQAVTDPGGTCAVRVADATPYWSVTAPGFIPVDEGGRTGPGRRVPRTFASVGVGSKRAWVCRLYALPRSEVILIVPDGNTGPIRVTRVPVDQWVVAEPGQRRFEFHVSPSGDVVIQAPYILQAVHPSQFRARFRDGGDFPMVYRRAAVDRHHGVALTFVDDDHAVRGPDDFRSVKRTLFFIGTASDADRIFTPYQGWPEGDYVYGARQFEAAWRWGRNTEPLPVQGRVP